jgi:hypothetical protein
MCLVRIWWVLFWRAFADRRADQGVSRTFALFVPQFFSLYLFSIATREARLVLTAGV